MKKANTYLNFDGNALEAFEFYRSVFGGEFTGVLKMSDMIDVETAKRLTSEELNRIAHIALPIGKNDLLMGSDIIPSFGHTQKVGNNAYIHLETETLAETEQFFNLFSDRGEIEMKLSETEWAELFGICKDRFGVQWILNFPGSKENSFN